MIETVTSYASSISWTFAGAGVLLILLGIAAIFFPKPPAISAAIAFFAGAAFCFWIGTIITQRDAARKEAAAARREAAESDAARRTCLGKLDGWIAVAAEQNTAVETLRRESARRLAMAAKAASEREAEAEARGRSAGALAALSASPARDGDETCAAADRLIVEALR